MKCMSKYSLLYKFIKKDAAKTDEPCQAVVDNKRSTITTDADDDDWMNPLLFITTVKIKMVIQISSKIPNLLIKFV